MKDSNVEEKPQTISCAIDSPREFNAEIREQLTKIRREESDKMICIEILPSMVDFIISDPYPTTIKYWLENNGFTVCVCDKEGVVAIDRALSRYGEGVRYTFFFQLYVDALGWFYDPNHPRYPEMGGKGKRMDKRCLDDFAVFVKKLMFTPGPTREEKQKRKTELFGRSPALRARLSKCLQ